MNRVKVHRSVGMGSLGQHEPDVKAPVLRRQTLGSQVYECLKTAILLDELRPGERLNEVEIAKRLGVSPTPVREAINKLKGDGIVTTSPGQGCYLREFGVRDIRNLFELRFAMERLGLEQGIPQLALEDLDRLGRIERDYEQAYESDPVDRLRAATANAQFHQFFASVAQNEWLVAVINNLDTYLHVVRAPLTVASTGHLSVEEHRAIVRAAHLGSVAEAVERLRDHIFRLQDEAVHAHGGVRQLP